MLLTRLLAPASGFTMRGEALAAAGGCPRGVRALSVDGAVGVAGAATRTLDGLIWSDVVAAAPSGAAIWAALTAEGPAAFAP